MMTDDRLRALELTVAEHLATVRAHMQAMEEREAQQADMNARLMKLVEGVHGTVHGEGESPGIKGRLDRLEQRGRFVSWFATTALGGVILHSIKWITERT